MPATDRARFEALLDVLDELREANREAPILVEGKRDVATLRALGCDGEIVQLHSGRTLHDVFESLGRAHPRVLIMVDWDRQGGRYRGLAERLASPHGARLDSTYRDAVRELLDLPIKDVESLHAYVTRGLAQHFNESVEEHLTRRRGHRHFKDPSEGFRA